MAKYLLMYQCRPGTEEEYIERHKNVWPTVIQALKEAGIESFFTFMKGNQLYGVIEAENFQESWAKFQGNPNTVKWEEYMSEVLVTDVTEAGDLEVIDQVVFELK